MPSKVIGALGAKLAAEHWPAGYSFSFGGEQAETEASFARLGVAAMAALLLVSLLLVVILGRITLSLAVMAAVPYVLIGALGGLWVSHNPFGFMAFLGLVSLIGVYVNHKIYFVDRMQELVGRGVPWDVAIVRAGVDRLRPVVLTALTAVLGLIPLTLSGGAMWAGFGWVSIVGLTSSIPLSLVLLPALVALAYRLRDGRPRHAVTVASRATAAGLAARVPPPPVVVPEDDDTLVMPQPPFSLPRPSRSVS